MDLQYRKIIKKIPLFLFLLLTLVSCQQKRESKENQLSSIQIVDRNGFNETLNAKDRLKNYQRVNFLEPQPYQKVVRAFQKDREGKTQAVMTTYHDNGQIYQYLQLSNGRAHGIYKEWFPSGFLRIRAFIAEGIGDLTEGAQQSWKFDGPSSVFNENGQKIAIIQYKKGVLDGISSYYHQTGELAKVIPYKKDLIDGDIDTYDQLGNQIGKISYVEGRKHGSCFYLGNQKEPKREEFYQNGYLMNATYYNFDNSILQKIEKGYGTKVLFQEGKLKSLCEYRMGLPEGKIEIFREDGSIESIYHIHNGKKHGEEKVFYSCGEEKEAKPFLEIEWKEDEIHGVIKTWYYNGQKESEKEMRHNKKNGLALAWYRNGSLMMIEEYENDQLVTGKYLKKGEEEPISRVIRGHGCANLYDAEGDFLKKIEYRGGKPVDND